jgi:O-antigen ligase
MRLNLTFLTNLIVALSTAGYAVLSGVSSILGVDNTPLSVTMRAVLVGISVVVLLYCVGRLRRTGPLALGLITLLLLYGLRLLVETWFDAQSLSQEPYLYWIWYLGVVSIPVITVLLSGRLEFVLLQRMLFVMFVFAGIAAALYSSVLNVSGGQIVLTGRAALESLNPISLGHVGASLVLLSIWGLFGHRLIRANRNYLLVLTMLLGLYLVFISASKGPAISLSLTLLFMAFVLRDRLGLLVGGTAILLPSFVYLISVEAQLNVSFVSRLTGILSDNDMSNSIRIDLYQSALTAIAENPFFGSGIEIPTYASYPHNFFLEYFMATGLFGGLISVIVFAMLLWRAALLIRTGSSAAGIALLFLNAFFGSLFSGAVYSHSTLWITAAVVALVPVSRLSPAAIVEPPQLRFSPSASIRH